MLQPQQWHHLELGPVANGGTHMSAQLARSRTESVTGELFRTNVAHQAIDRGAWCMANKKTPVVRRKIHQLTRPFLLKAYHA